MDAPMRVILEELMLSFSFSCYVDDDLKLCEKIKNNIQTCFSLSAEKEIFDLFVYPRYEEIIKSKAKANAKQNQDSFRNNNDLEVATELSQSELDKNNGQIKNPSEDIKKNIMNNSNNPQEASKKLFENNQLISNNTDSKFEHSQLSHKLNNISMNQDNSNKKMKIYDEQKNTKYNELLSKLTNLSKTYNNKVQMNCDDTFLNIYFEIKQFNFSLFDLLLKSKIKYKILLDIWEKEQILNLREFSKNYFPELLFIKNFCRKSNKWDSMILKTYYYKEDFINFINNKANTIKEKENKNYIQNVQNIINITCI